MDAPLSHAGLPDDLHRMLLERERAQTAFVREIDECLERSEREGHALDARLAEAQPRAEIAADRFRAILLAPPSTCRRRTWGIGLGPPHHLSH